MSLGGSKKVSYYNYSCFSDSELSDCSYFCDDERSDYNLNVILKQVETILADDKTTWVPLDGIPSMLPANCVLYTEVTINSGMTNNTTSSSFSSLSPVAPAEIPSKKRKNNSQGLVEESEESVNEIDYKVFLAIASIKGQHTKVTDDKIKRKAGIDQTTLDESKRRLKEKGYFLNKRNCWHTFTAKGSKLLEEKTPRSRDFSSVSPVASKIPVSENATTSSAALSFCASLTFQYGKNANSQSLVEESEQSVNETDKNVLVTIDSLKKKHLGVNNASVKKQLKIDQATLNASKIRLKAKGYLSEETQWWHTITPKGKQLLREQTSLEERNPKRRKTQL